MTEEPKARGKQAARLRLCLLLIPLLAGCATVKDEAAMPVHVAWSNVEDVQATCEKLSGRREMFRVLGCSRWRDVAGQRTCTIYAPAPRNEDDRDRFATLGHELMHCTKGKWHDRWGRMHDEKVREARHQGAARPAETVADRN